MICEPPKAAIKSIVATLLFHLVQLYSKASFPLRTLINGTMREDVVSQIQKFGTGSSSFAIHDAGAISPEWYRGAHTPDRQTERASLLLFPS